MKNNLILIIGTVTLLSFSTFAQTEKRAFLVGGTLGSSGFTLSTRNTFSIGIDPNIGYFVADNFAIGAGIITGFVTATGVSFIQYGISPFAKRYFGESKTRPFLRGDIGYNGSASLLTSGSTNYFTMGLSIGLASFIHDNVALELILGYNGTTDDFTYVWSSINLRAGFQIHLPAKAKE